MEKGEPDHGECNYGKDPCANGIGYWSITTITTHDVHVPRKCSYMYSTIVDNRHMFKERIYPKDEILVSIKKEPQTVRLPLVVVEGAGPPLYGRNWLAHILIN